MKGMFILNKEVDTERKERENQDNEIERINR